MVVTEVVVNGSVSSGGNQWTVLLLLELGDGLVDKTKETFQGGKIRGRRADVVSGGLWDDRGVSQWVDQQDARRNGIGVSWVLEDGGEKDGRLGGGDGDNKSGVVIPKRRGGTQLGRQWVMVGPNLSGRPKEVFNGLTSSLDVELVDIVKV